MNMKDAIALAERAINALERQAAATERMKEIAAEISSLIVPEEPQKVLPVGYITDGDYMMELYCIEHQLVCHSLHDVWTHSQTHLNARFQLWSMGKVPYGENTGKTV